MRFRLRDDKGKVITHATAHYVEVVNESDNTVVKVLFCRPNKTIVELTCRDGVEMDRYARAMGVQVQGMVELNKDFFINPGEMESDSSIIT